MSNVKALPSHRPHRRHGAVEAARQIAAPLHDFEDDLHRALVNNARTTIAMIEGRRMAGLDISQGVDTLDRNLQLGPKIMAVVRETLGMHAECIQHGRRAGIFAFGDTEETFSVAPDGAQLAA